MTADAALALLPLLALAAGAVVVLVMIGVRRSHPAVCFVACGALAASFGAIFASGAIVPVAPLFLVDRGCRFFLGLILFANLCVCMLSYRYQEAQVEHKEELYLLLLLQTLGGAVLICASHFVSFFLGLEILSVSLYGLIAYNRSRPLSIEAGIKYLLLAAIASAFLLFGMALIYCQYGTLAFAEFLAPLSAVGGDRPLALAGLALLVVGIGFKLALVPFHMWTGDVYQGAPAPVTTAIATVSKIAVFAFFLRFLHCTDIAGHSGLYWLFVSIASASMLLGNWLALLQDNVKRLLAYSSIAHLGYLLIPLIAGGARGVSTACFYLVAYTIATLGGFGVVTVMSRPEREAGDMSDFAGLAWRRPLLAGVFIVMLFALAGVPLTAGFLAKLFVVTTAAGSGLWLLAAMLVAGSAIGVFFYLRLVAAQVAGGAAPAGEGLRSSAAAHEAAVLVLLALLQLALGVYPQPLLALIESLPFVAR